jgi:hypothetical protein
MRTILTASNYSNEANTMSNSTNHADGLDTSSGPLVWNDEPVKTVNRRQKHIADKMTNWQRTQWAATGYDINRVEEFVKLKRPNHKIKPKIIGLLAQLSEEIRKQLFNDR